MNLESILIFEPKRVEDFYPFSVLHCLWELRCGALRLYEKINFQFPHSKLIFYAKEKRLKSFLERFSIINGEFEYEDLLAVDATVVPNKIFFDEIKKGYAERKKASRGPAVFYLEGKPVAAYFPAEELQLVESISPELLTDLTLDIFKKYQRIDIARSTALDYVWDCLDATPAEINRDAELLDIESIKEPAFYPGAHFVSQGNIYVGSGVNISPGCVIDASAGAVIVESNVKIMPNTFIEGPCFIGSYSMIKAGAKIYGGTSIGEVCKIGGEVENSIIHAYSNKQHEGFLGHSYLCEWVNLGADTNTSDLKNNYANIMADLDGKDVSTGRLMLGAIIGDHTKTAINSMFNTGSTIGIFNMAASPGFLPKFMPSFTWLTDRAKLYRVEYALQTTKIVMSRRNRAMHPAEQALIEAEYARVKAAGAFS